MLDICITDHLMWRWRVYNMILGYEKIDVDKVGTHHECRLGKWYYTLGGEAFAGNKIFAGLENPHAALHNLAREAAFAYAAKDVKKAETSLAQMDMCSKQVVEALNMLKRE